MFGLRHILTLPKAAWVRHMSKEFPTLAFHANINNSFGKGSLIALLRQFSALHSDRKQISVGLIGYPNTGKSSIINTLRKKRVCNVAPVAGETKVWQYVTLMKRIYLIDCPGIVPPNQSDTDETLLLKGSIRVENVEFPAQYIDTVLQRVQHKHMTRTYDIKVDENTTSTDFLEQLCRKQGRLLKGGEPDLDGCAKLVLNDWIRGKIPWFTPPPYKEGEEGDSAPVKADREGRLGEMSKKRKRDGDSETVATASAAAPSDKAEVEDDDAVDSDDFSGFDSEDDEGGVELGDDGSEDEDEDEEYDEAAVEADMAAISEALAEAKGKGAKRQKR